MLSRRYIQNDVLRPLDVNDLLLMDHSVPGFVCRLILHRFAAAACVLDVNVLHLSTKIRKSPRNMVVVADDDERHSRQRDA